VVATSLWKASEERETIDPYTSWLTLTMPRWFRWSRRPVVGPARGWRFGAVTLIWPPRQSAWGQRTLEPPPGRCWTGCGTCVWSRLIRRRADGSPPPSCWRPMPSGSSRL